MDPSDIGDSMRVAKPGITPETESLFNEALRYEEKREFRKAFECLLAAARLGHTGSQISVANFYAWGRGVRKNPDKATYWYKQAYKNGDSTGALNLAIDMRNHRKVRSAVIWFNKAVAMNDGDALIPLAKIYIDRKGGQKTATDLLRRARQMSRENISDDAKEQAESLLKKMAKIKRH
jgi:TPR repeat protein